MRTDLRIRSSPETVTFPLSSAPGEIREGDVLGEEEFEPVREAGPRSYRERLDLPEKEAALLPRAFDVVGEIVLIRLPPELLHRKAIIGAALLEFVPGARLVGLDLGVKGVERRRSLERLAGEGPWSTRHAENGLTIDVDLERVYFSPRLAREHARVAREVREGDGVLDLCCGAGPFSLTIARDGRARQIVAVDLNPAAVELGRANAHRLGFDRRIEFVEARVEDVLGRFHDADRVIFNLPHEGIKYLPQVATTVGPGGSIYYYEVTEMERETLRPQALVALLPGGAGEWEAGAFRRVHPYSPTLDLMAYTLRRAP